MNWLADENLRSAILRGMLRHAPAIDIVRAQDIPEISGRDDRTLLHFAAVQGRVVITHDVSTIVPIMREIVESGGSAYPRIVLVPDDIPVHSALDDLLLLDECAVEADWAAGVIYLPLR